MSTKDRAAAQKKQVTLAKRSTRHAANTATKKAARGTGADKCQNGAATKPETVAFSEGWPEGTMVRLVHDAIKNGSDGPRFFVVVPPPPGQTVPSAKHVWTLHWSGDMAHINLMPRCALRAP